MEVFIGNLSAEATLVEIHNILGEFQMHSDFTTHEGKTCDHTQYHFVVVNTANSEQAEKLITRLNGYELCGMQLDVRKYIHRSIEQQAQWQGEDRRVNEQMPLAL